MISRAVWPLRSLQARFLWATVLVIFVLMTAVIVIVEHRQRAGIIGEVERRGEVLTRNLAALSHAPLLLYNCTALEQNVARVGSEEDVRYAIILDAESRVAAHSVRPDRVGAMLDDVVSRRAVDMRMRGLPREQVEMNLERLRHGAQNEAIRELKLFFVLEKLATEQNVDVDEAELNGRIAMLAVQGDRRPEKLKQEMAKDGSLANGPGWRVRVVAEADAWLERQEPMRRLVRAPAQVAPGTWAARKPGGSDTSSSQNTTRKPVAIAIARLRAAPRLVRSSYTYAIPNGFSRRLRSTTWAVASVEPLSTTKVSSTVRLCALNDSRHSTNMDLPFQFTMIALTVLIATISSFALNLPGAPLPRA